MSPTYIVTLLPKSHPDPAIWSRIIAHQKDFRLRSLQISPESFSSSYEREEQFSDKDWEARLQNPLAYTFIILKCSKTETETNKTVDLTDIVDGEWVGMGVLAGPMGDLPGNMREMADEERCTEFEISGVFVLPGARNLGLGKSLVEATVEHGKSLGKQRGASEVLVKVSAASTNVQALKLYERLGFSVIASDQTDSEEAPDTVVMQWRLQI
ncbi:hypothetical protein CC78DRAFT_531186 [Lojkania enalia]|uniref:N-acetyltransferase domain-containing protein n=1 Tax=Lojkania enalia TaxID=147567 RepID=A0A9P4KG73_9PLEO|nr:hypothetical protein CC78DRAFT_531186 [Didymosphaeria enalia]